MKREQDFFEKLESTNKKAKCINDEVGNSLDDIMFYSKNTIANILKSISWVVLGLGFVFGFVMCKSKYDELNFLYLIQIWVMYGGFYWYIWIW